LAQSNARQTTQSWQGGMSPWQTRGGWQICNKKDGIAQCIAFGSGLVKPQARFGPVETSETRSSAKRVAYDFLADVAWHSAPHIPPQKLGAGYGASAAKGQGQT
jgi:hypothetical protein